MEGKIHRDANVICFNNAVFLLRHNHGCLHITSDCGIVAGIAGNDFKRQLRISENHQPLIEFIAELGVTESFCLLIHVRPEECHPEDDNRDTEKGEDAPVEATVLAGWAVGVWRLWSVVLGVGHDNVFRDACFRVRKARPLGANV